MVLCVCVSICKCQLAMPLSCVAERRPGGSDKLEGLCLSSQAPAPCSRLQPSLRRHRRCCALAAGACRRRLAPPDVLIPLHHVQAAFAHSIHAAPCCCAAHLDRQAEGQGSATLGCSEHQLGQTCKQSLQYALQTADAAHVVMLTTKLVQPEAQTRPAAPHNACSHLLCKVGQLLRREGCPSQ